MNPWHRTPAGGLEPGPYPDVPGYAEAAREAYDTGQAVQVGPVHNHGPEEGLGLDCPEQMTPLGLRGLCRRAANVRPGSGARGVV